MEQRILCYGDSNTWGYIPGRGERYGERERFTGVLARELGEEYRVVEEGLSGRTTVFSDRIEPMRCGIEHLLPFILSHLPLNYMVIMLGTNDTKTHFHVNAQEIGYGMEELIVEARHILQTRGSEAEILLVAPVPISSCSDPQFDQESAFKSEELGTIYQELAVRYGCLFLDGKTVTRELGEDGIHLSLKGHEKLGKAIAQVIKEHKKGGDHR